MSKMFTVDGKRVKTYNPVTGCLGPEGNGPCVYCFAKMLAEGKLADTPKYRDCGFKPTYHPKEFEKNLGRNNIYFVCDMGDLWGSWVPSEWIRNVWVKCFEADQSNEFWFLTKNPKAYSNFLWGCGRILPSNFVYGVTSERDYPHRLKPMMDLKAEFPRTRVFVSVEPVMDFDTEAFVTALSMLGPDFIYIGYDSGRHPIKEPPLRKVMDFIGLMQARGIEVRTKLLREARA
jgi:protein gp37